jgi:DNA-directed RNA polymerase subunit E'/Rpb7
MSDSPFFAVNLEFKVALPPLASSAPLVHVRKQLNGMLHRYLDEARGVLLSVGELKLIEGKECARIIGEFPWLHVNVTSKCLVFRPESGQTVKGTITSVS